MLITNFQKEKHEKLAKKEQLKKHITKISLLSLSVLALIGAGYLVSKEFIQGDGRVLVKTNAETTTQILDEMSIKDVAAMTIIYAHHHYPKNKAWTQIYKDALKGKITIKRYKKYTFDGYNVKAAKGAYIYVINGKGLFIFNPNYNRILSSVIVGDNKEEFGTFKIKRAYTTIKHKNETQQIYQISNGISFEEKTVSQPDWQVAERLAKGMKHENPYAKEKEFHLGSSKLLASSSTNDRKSLVKLYKKIEKEEKASSSNSTKGTSSSKKTAKKSSTDKLLATISHELKTTPVENEASSSRSESHSKASSERTSSRRGSNSSSGREKSNSSVSASSNSVNNNTYVPSTSSSTNSSSSSQSTSNNSSSSNSNSIFGSNMTPSQALAAARAAGAGNATSLMGVSRDSNGRLEYRYRSSTGKTMNDNGFTDYTVHADGSVTSN